MNGRAFANHTAKASVNALRGQRSVLELQHRKLLEENQIAQLGFFAHLEQLENLERRDSTEQGNLPEWFAPTGEKICVPPQFYALHPSEIIENPDRYFAYRVLSVSGIHSPRFRNLRSKFAAQSGLQKYIAWLEFMLVRLDKSVETLLEKPSRVVTFVKSLLVRRALSPLEQRPSIQPNSPNL
jgi:hypothetical protein